VQMTRRFSKDVVHRWEGNPLISIEDLDFRCSDIRSPGVARYQSEVVLLVTIELPAKFANPQIFQSYSQDSPLPTLRP